MYRQRIRVTILRSSPSISASSSTTSIGVPNSIDAKNDAADDLSTSEHSSNQTNEILLTRDDETQTIQPQFRYFSRPKSYKLLGNTNTWAHWRSQEEGSRDWEPFNFFPLIWKIGFCDHDQADQKFLKCFEFFGLQHLFLHRKRVDGRKCGWRVVKPIMCC